MSKKRIDTRSERDPLTDNPFAQLSGKLPEGAPERELPEQPEKPDKNPWRVAKTRKGGWPLSIEKRAGGKVATILANVGGDAEALLKTLKKQCATGGAVRENAVELQGDQRKAIEAFLNRQ